MSTALFNRNPDLSRLREEGYAMRITGGALVMHEVPYVNARREIKLGTITSSLCLSGDITKKPEPHTVEFRGEFPCNADGSAIRGITPSGAIPANLLLPGTFTLSSRPGAQGYQDYYQKMSTYATIVAGPAAVVKPGTTPRVYMQPDADEDCVFNYLETASDRVGIARLTTKLENDHIAIIGVGGTGSYVLDLIAKTPVREIRLIDGDDFLQHNAFRAPGASSIEMLREMPKKVDYFANIYSKMHRHIVPHAVQFDVKAANLLEGITFAFLCMDASESKRIAVQKLEALGVPFIDVGMGLELVDDTLGGILRVTTSIPEKRERAKEHISFEGGGREDIYASNIQVADLNMLNAAFAVIKWKKLKGFYRDLEKEHHSTYTTDGNMLLNGDHA